MSNISRFPNLSELSIAILENLAEKVIGEAGVEKIKEPLAQKQLEDSLEKALHKTEERFLEYFRLRDRDIYEIFFSLPVNNLPSFKESVWDFFQRPVGVKLSKSLWNELVSYKLPEDRIERAVNTFVDILREEFIISVPEIREVLNTLASVQIQNNTSLILKILENLEIQVFPATNVAIGKNVTSFDTIIATSTKDFVGRDFVFDALDSFIQNNSSGYFVIRGDPGIGKTAFISQLVKTRDLVHHFNVIQGNIRSPKQFHINICAQLIIRYDLKELTFPSWGEIEDNTFLMKCLESAARKLNGQPLLLALDSLDEADWRTLPVGVNVHYLPRDLPDSVFFVVTTRPETDIPLNVSNPKTFLLRQDNVMNDLDIRHFITNYAQREKMRALLFERQIKEFIFVEKLAKKSQGNFIYLRFVLPAIENQNLLDHSIEQLPEGLEEFYKRHWKEMQLEVGGSFKENHEKVICILAVMTDLIPLEAIAEWTNLPLRDVDDIRKRWEPFLFDQIIDGEKRYRIYHASFGEFLGRAVNLNFYKDIVLRRFLRNLNKLEDNAMNNSYLAYGKNYELNELLLKGIELGYLDELSFYFSDFEFIEAAIITLTTDSFYGICIRLNSVTPPNHTLKKTLAQVEQLLSLEAHNFRQLSSVSHEAFVLQQLHNRAKELNSIEIVKNISDCLLNRRLPYLDLKWSTRIGNTPQIRTIVPLQPVYSVSVTSDEELLVGGGRISTSPIQVWNLESGELLWSSINIGKIVTLEGISQAVCVSEGGDLILWDLINNTQIWSVPTNDEYTTGLLLIQPHKKTITANLEGTIKIWDLNNGRLTYVIKGQSRIHKLGLIPGKPWFGSISDIDSSFIIWNYETGLQELILLGHQKGIVDFAITENGKYAATISYDNTVKIWNLDSESVINEYTWYYEEELDDDFEGISLSTVKVLLCQELLIFTSDVYGTIEVWNYEKGIKKYTLEKQLNWYPYNIKVLSSHKYIVISYGPRIRIFELETGLLVGQATEHESQISHFDLSSNEKFLFSSDYQTIKIWDFQQLIKSNNTSSKNKHNNSVEKIITSVINNEEKIISVSRDETKVRGLTEEAEIFTFELSGNFLEGITLLPDKERVIVNNRYEFSVCNLASKLEEVKVTFEESGIDHFSIAPDVYLASTLITNFKSAQVKIYDLKTGKNVQTINNLDKNLRKVWISPNGRWLLFECDDNFIELIYVSKGYKKKEIRLFTNYASKLAVSSKKKRIIEIEDRPREKVRLRFWDSESESPLPFFETEDDFSNKGLALSLDEEVVITLAFRTEELTVWDIVTGGVVNRFTVPECFGGQVVPLTKELIVIAGAAKNDGGWVGEIELWNIKTGQKVKIIGRHPSSHTFFAALDGRMLVSNSLDQLIIWNIETGSKEIIEGHFSANLIITPDGQNAIDAREETIRVWKLKTRQEEVALSDHTSKVDTLVVSSDGYTLVSTSKNEIIVWDLKTYQKKQIIDIKNQSSVSNIAISREGEEVILSRYGKGLKVEERVSENVILDFSAQANLSEFHGFTGDSKAILSRLDKTIICRDIESDTETPLIEESFITLFPNRFPSFRNPPDIRNKVVDWDLVSRYFGKTLKAPHDIVLNLNSQRAICKQGSRTMYLWNIEVGKTLVSTMFDAEPECALFAKNENIVIVGDKSGHIHCFEILNC